MKYFLLLFIKFYQTFTPKKFRGKCLFKESCSHFVYRITEKEGLKSGLEALLYRFHNCRSGYHFSVENGMEVLRTVENEVIEKKLINDRIFLEQNQYLHE